jgi:hypothetical protein
MPHLKTECTQEFFLYRVAQRNKYLISIRLMNLIQEQKQMSETVFNVQDWVYVPDEMGRLGQGYYKNRKNSAQTITVAEFERRRTEPVKLTTKKQEQNINNIKPAPSASPSSGRLQTSGATDSQLTPWSNPQNGEETISESTPTQTQQATPITTKKTQEQSAEEKAAQKKKEEQAQAVHNGGDGGNTDTGADSSEGGAKVICTEMGSQGLMSLSDQKACMIYAHKSLPESFMTGYHFWAVPYVRLMRYSKWATVLMAPLVRYRTCEVKFRLGLEKKGTWQGKLICGIHDPFCSLLGKIVKPVDYRSLYRFAG